MTILQGDIKLVASQVMDDVPEGGGAPTSTVIADGVSNAIFNDISELDRAGGRVNLRKAFVNVQTDNVDGYFGANVIVAQPPLDPRVSVTLFSTREAFDRRDDAKARVESYLARGPTYGGYLFGNHITGMKTLTLLARATALTPVVGATLVLNKLEGTAGAVEQFVRATKVTTHERTFEDEVGTFVRTEITLEISDPLRADFPGFEALRYDASMNFTGRTRVSDSIVADAANYYGVAPITEDASLGDFSLKAASIFSQIVPSAQIETPIADARMNQQSAALVASGGAQTQTLNLIFRPTQSMYIGGGILPSSLSIVRSGMTLVDVGGKLINQADTVVVGSVDYGNGIVALSTDVFGSGGGNHVVTFTPAATPTVISESIGIPVTQASQRLTYVATLDPAPARASAIVSFRAQGRWYILTEDGSGALRGGDSSSGVGALNFSTGTIQLTLGALPDVGSEVIIGWQPVVANQTQSSQPIPPTVISNSRVFHAINLGRTIKPGTLSISWNDGSARTATDLNGALVSAAAIGEVEYAKGFIRISPNVLPAVDTVFTVALTEGTDIESDVATFTDNGATWGFTLSGVTRAGSVEIGIAAQHVVRQFPGIDATIPKLVRVFDDGGGNLKVAAVTSNITIGTINYSTGVCTIDKTVATYQDVQPVYADKTPFGSPVTDSTRVMLTGTATRTLTLTPLNGTGSALSLPAWAWWVGSFGVAAKVKRVGADGSAYSGDFPLTNLAMRRMRFSFKLGSDIYKVTAGGIGSLNFSRNINPSTGEGTLAGNGYNTGNGLYGVPARFTYADNGGYVLVSLWTAGISSAVLEETGVVTPPIAGASTFSLVDGAVFRTAISPIRNGSFSVAGTFQSTATFSATADADGIIKTGTNFTSPSVHGTFGVFGKIDYSTGIAKVRFGRRVHADNAGNPGVVDMSDLALSGVQYVEVIGVQADTLRYNAAAYVYLPLDASILGIDPVRLPSDGRVPIFRPGSFAVVGHTNTTSPGAVTNAQTINFGRVRLSRVRVLGSDGLVINTGYTADLEAGTITFTNVAGYSQPVTIEDRIEDMMLVSDAQINGQLTFTRALTHDYPEGCYVSSALVIGDMKARVSALFDQATWNSTWSDTVIGSSAAATYNDVLAPLQVTNKGAATERWALVFTNTTTFNVVGEHVGIIAGGNTTTDLAPVNPATGEPYFTLLASGWGSGWSAGNALRFDTVGSLFPLWIVRTIQQGPETVDDDSFTVLIRGDVDHP